MLDEMYNLEDSTYTTGDDDVTDGSVEYYDFDWGLPVQTREIDIFSGCNTDSNGEPINICTGEPVPEPDCSCEPENNGDENQDNNEEEEYPIVEV